MTSPWADPLLNLGWIPRRGKENFCLFHSVDTDSGSHLFCSLDYMGAFPWSKELELKTDHIPPLNVDLSRSPERSKTRVYDRSLAGIKNSNPAEGWDVCRDFCVPSVEVCARGRFLV